VSVGVRLWAAELTTPVLEHFERDGVVQQAHDGFFST
jgi:hypothetical protein